MKPTEVDIAEVLRLYNAPKEKFARKVTIASLSRRFGISIHTIRKIINDNKN